jgi:uncharacterized Zn finger protein
VRFDINTLRELAGAKSFARGQDYHRSGSVEILSIRPGKVVAEVTGTDDYRTSLTGSGTEIDGECTCPAFSDWGFCKHLVAVALAANAVKEGVDGDAAGVMPRVREHLRAKSKDQLLEMVLGFAELQPELLHKLDTQATVALEFYAARIEQLAISAAYEEAMKLVRRMAKLQSTIEHAALLSQLRERHKRKRNFMKLLG